MLNYFNLKIFWTTKITKCLGGLQLINDLDVMSKCVKLKFARDTALNHPQTRIPTQTIIKGFQNHNLQMYVVNKNTRAILSTTWKSMWCLWNTYTIFHNLHIHLQAWWYYKPLIFRVRGNLRGGFWFMGDLKLYLCQTVTKLLFT